MSWEDVLKTLVFWGPGALIAGLIIYALYDLAKKFGGKFIESQQNSAIALAAQATAMESLQKSMHDYVTRDDSEHREMLVLLKYLAQDKVDFDRVRIEHDTKRCDKEL